MAIALFASYSCEDNDVYTPSQAEMTALDIMKQDPDFADFLAVVDLCGAHCADSLFNQSRIYTIFAPVKGCLDVPAIEERIARGDREGVFKEYVESHIANFRHPANGDVKDKLLMLNDKLVEFVGDIDGGYTFGNSKLLEINIQAKNAIIHKISEPFDYKPSLWESLKNIDLVSSFWSFCAKFTKKEFDPGNSIPGDIVNQEQTYRDSAFRESNEMQSIMGSINNEDSLMIMYAPSNALWEEICTTAESYFNYDTVGYNKKQRLEADSIKKLRGVKYYLDYLTYSLSDQRVNGQIVTDYDNLPDSLAVRKVTYPRKKYARDEFLIVDEFVASNGRLKVVDAMPVNPYNLWVDTIRLEPESKDSEGFVNVRKVGDKYKEVKNDNALYEVVSVKEKEQNPDVVGKLSNGSYLKAYQPDIMKNYEMPQMTFFVKDVLSTKYKIALITPPWFIKSYNDTVITRSDEPPYADSFLRVTVKQGDEVLGMFPEDSILDFNGDYGVPMEKAVCPDKSRIDTLFLKDANGEDFIFDFKACENYSGLTEIQPNKKENINKFYTVEIKVELIKPLVIDEFFSEILEENVYLPAEGGFAYRFLLDQIMLVPVNPADSGTNAGN